MILGIVILAMMAGGVAATTALMAGHSVWMALAIYSGGGTVAVLVIALMAAGLSALRSPKAEMRRSSATILS